MEDRIRQLETDVTGLRIQAARVDGAVENLNEAVKELREVVSELRDTMNKGRGVIWAITLAAGVAGSAIAVVVKRLFGV